MNKWEYKLIDTQEDLKKADVIGLATREQIEAYLSQLGEEGWEIVSATFPHETRRQEICALARRPC